MKTVYCIGNPALPGDRLALELADEFRLDGFEFVKVRSPEELFEKESGELIIMDTAKGIDEVTIFSDLSKLKSANMISLHDFDLSYFLQLMEKMGTLPKLTIIALPMGKGKEEIRPALTEVLRSLGG